ncbi:MAG: bifunctional glutamate N-acetyltransferase/amino-acid acetyltransferase ArgJ [Clostridiaceae bacterium]|nr:bifunctional glutamate N-acetyltransferase/amino-acid acetyltransferase ArgJ [Clostridiaceae bacterium]
MKQQITGGVTAPKGYSANGVYAGISKTPELVAARKPDLALLVSDPPAQAAGVFTTNLVKGHSLQRTARILQAGASVNAIVINSGNANACVGASGDQAADALAATVAAELGCDPDRVLTGSTGIIGHALPNDRIAAAVPALCQGLESGADGASRAAEAILTTDTIKKEAAVTLEIDGRTVTVGGMAKGSGMIHPNMATMIGVVTTDCALAPALLRDMLTAAVRKSFNRISVDGDTSVCDMVILLANGAAGNPTITDPASASAALFQAALNEVCLTLAKLCVIDGEGATKLVNIIVERAADDHDAYLAALAVARSPLVKTALFGQDPNWGRILTAVGYSGAKFDPEQVDIHLGSILVCDHGQATGFDRQAAREVLREKDVTLRIDLRAGEGRDEYWTCDFSFDYVRINAEYPT